ncbi:hypothetical protein Adt_11687 [Abeliophyllum distichum]|uniref:Uncharacterized protein n=1 Tax=Abeliophyllum distichum TaxID=126358 RepID=A0ABD1UNJ6_9LAMI
MLSCASMADVMSHGGNGAEDPSQQPPHRLDSTYESALPSKRRGIFRGINLEKIWQANEKRPLPTIQSIENNVKYFTRLVGNQNYFDLQSDRLPDEYWAVCAAVDHLAADRY